MDDDPAEEEDDFEVDLEAVDVVSFAWAGVSLGFNALASDSILAATAPVIQVYAGVVVKLFFRSMTCVKVHYDPPVNPPSRHNMYLLLCVDMMLDR